ncbi:MAG: hypothetical protein EOM12_15175 [Verrucomicrobiae bacterium]|nr:hypothetical protein [Verrucomicrobiae bacterium]
MGSSIDENELMSLRLVAAIAAAGAMISGAILRLERSGKLQDEIQVLRAENAKLEALLDQALKTLHHERLMHLGEDGAVGSGDRSEP